MFLCITAVSIAQTMDPIKYKDEVFQGVTIQKNISYVEGKQPGVKKKHHLFDLYEAKEDSSLTRPLIIWMHGGGFKLGSKHAKGIRIWSRSFAKRGYVSVGLNYRLSKSNPLFNFTELKRSCYDGVQDVKEAIAFFKKNHAQFRIDTNRIILAGNSAGGMIALHAAYTNEAELAASAQMTQTGLSTVYNPAKIAAVVNFWGGLFNINWLTNTRVPIASVHGSNDRLIRIGHKDTSLYGSADIHEMADKLKIPNELKIFEGYSHELQKHFNPLFHDTSTETRWLEAGQFAADFLYRELFKRFQD